MGAHSSKEKLSRSYSERYIHSQMIERERFGSFGKRTKSTTKGAAKKRDVRNLSISPTDLGPPPKTQQTIKGQSTRSKSSTPTATHKSTSKTKGGNAKSTKATDSWRESNGQMVTAVKPSGILQYSPPEQILGSNIGGSPTTPTGTGTGGHPKESLRVDQTELQELNKRNSETSTPPSTLPEIDVTPKSNNDQCNCDDGDESREPSEPVDIDTVDEAICVCEEKALPLPLPPLPLPLPMAEESTLVEYSKQDTTTNLFNNPTTTQEMGIELEKTEICIPSPKTNGNLSKRSSKRVINEVEKSLTLKPLLNGKPIASAKPSKSKVNTIPSNPINVVDLREKYPSLQPFLKDDHIDYLLLERFITTNKFIQMDQDRQLMGLSVVVQFMCTEVENANEAVKSHKTELEQSKRQLQELQETCDELRAKLQDKDLEYMHNQRELEHMYCNEVKKVQEQSQENQLLAKERISELKAQLVAKETEAKQAIEVYKAEMTLKLSHQQDKLTAAEEQVLALQARLQQAQAQEQELREKITRKENTLTGRINAVTQREQETNENIKMLTKELNTLRAVSERKERDLQDRITLMQDEIVVLNTSRRSLNESSSLNVSLESSAELCRLNNEAESLRCVLELKQADISTLSKQNAELKRENDERHSINNRVTVLEAQNEMLRSELEAKADKEKDYQRQIEELQKAFSHETVKQQRLIFDKEALQWHLKHRSEQLQLVEAKLYQMSHENPLNSTHNRSSLGSSERSSGIGSPPVSPIIKSVIEKSDSVSWVLEMDDETAEVAASKMVKRVGSLRSNNERRPTPRRTQSTCLSGSANKSPSICPNPLSQSMSATTVPRSHSTEPDISPLPLSRTRSHTMCMKMSNSSGDMPGTRNKSSSSPSSASKYKDEHRFLGALQISSDWPVGNGFSCGDSVRSRPRTSTMKPPSPSDPRAKQLITCDSSALNGGERLAAAAHKKFQEIQEAAGEAMVSSPNSEDESCSASSEDMRSSSSSSAASAKHNGAIIKASSPSPTQSRMSIEEALLLERVALASGSLNGTPMEVSWSEDAVDATEATYANGASA